MILSIVIPVYNMEKYIERCLDSILNQKYIKTFMENIEVLLINDGSTDSSLKILSSYEKKYGFVKVFDKKNGGVSDARNFGIKKAKGDYIWFIDSDDWIALDSLHIIFSELNENDLDILEFDFAKVSIANGDILITNETYYSKIQTKVVSGKMFLEEFGYLISVTSKVVKTALLLNNDIEFPLNRFSEESTPVLSLMLKSKRYKKINRVLYYYFSRENSRTTSKNITSMKKYNSDILINIREAIKMLEDVEDGFRKDKIYEMFSFSLSNIFLVIFKNKLDRQYLYSFIEDIKKLGIYPISKYSYYNKGFKRNLFRLVCNNTALLRCISTVVLPNSF